MLKCENSFGIFVLAIGGGMENGMNEKKYETECCKKTDSKKHIKEIDCDVKNCAYHDGVSDCYAGKICVGPRDANCSSGTSCATFKPREY